MAQPIALLLLQQTDLAVETHQLLCASERFDEVRVAEHGTAALRFSLASTRIDLVVLDLEQPGLNGERIIAGLRKNHPEIRVVLVTRTVDEISLMTGIRTGAGAVVPTTISAQELAVVAIRVAHGESLLSRDVMANRVLSQQLFSMLRAGRVEMELAETDQLFDQLTPREIAVFDGVVRGLTNRQIAELLFVTEQTVKNQMTVILRKLGVHDRGAAMEMAIRYGWTTVSRMDDSLIRHAS